MIKTFDMQDLRYLNLFEKITRVNTRYLFKYNNMLVFCVPKNLIKKALGENAKNLRRMSEILGKKIKVIFQPKQDEIKVFIETLISPHTFRDIEITENEIIINAGRISKAALIGRDKLRLEELRNIMQALFKKDVRIV